MRRGFSRIPLPPSRRERRENQEQTRQRVPEKRGRLGRTRSFPNSSFPKTWGESGLEGGRGDATVATTRGARGKAAKKRREEIGAVVIDTTRRYDEGDAGTSGSFPSDNMGRRWKSMGR